MKTGEVLITTMRVVLKATNEAEERAVKRKKPRKEGQKVAHIRSTKQCRGHLRNYENDVSDEDEDLANSYETVCSIPSVL